MSTFFVSGFSFTTSTVMVSCVMPAFKLELLDLLLLLELDLLLDLDDEDFLDKGLLFLDSTDRDRDLDRLDLEEMLDFLLLLECELTDLLLDLGGLDLGGDDFSLFSSSASSSLIRLKSMSTSLSLSSDMTILFCSENMLIYI